MWFHFIQLAEVMPFVLESSLSAISILTGQKRKTLQKGGFGRRCGFFRYMIAIAKMD